MILARATWRWDSRLEVSFPYSPELIAAIKSQIDPHYREWSPSTKTWIFDPPIGSTAMLQILRSYCPGFEVIDNRDAYQSPPPPFSQPEPKIDPDFARLYIMPTAPRCVVDAAYRALSKQCHPDRVPERERVHAHEEMIALTNAYDAVRDRVAS